MKLQIVFPEFDVTKAPQFTAPALARLLAVGCQQRMAGTVEALLCQAIGVSRQANWPLAPISRLGEGASDAGSGYWLKVDPVHLVLQRDYFSLGPRLLLSLEESQALLALLSQHFAADGLTFLAASIPGYWYLHLQDDPQISTAELSVAIGRDTTSYMPQGQGAARWNRLLNEMQMLLHEHPINQARELRGELAANSVWLSGGGVLPLLAVPANKAIYANDALSAGLALLAGQPARSLLADMHKVLDEPHGEVLLVMQESPSAELMEAVLHALKQRKISHLTMDFALHGEVLRVEAQPLDTWKFWKKPQSIASLLGLGA